MSNQNNLRLIARLDIKSENLIKGVHLEGLRVVGNPSDYASKYYREGLMSLYTWTSLRAFMVGTTCPA